MDNKKNIIHDIFISIIVPVYNEETAISLFITAITAELKVVTTNFEIIFINDGSIDNTLNNLLKIQKKTKQIKIINLTRNFGKEAALTAGLDHAAGEIVIPMDVDMQDPPYLIPLMVQKWKEGFDVVLARRASRLSDSVAKRITARLFYWLWNRISCTQLPENVGDYRLMDRKVVEAIKLLREKNRFIKGIFAWAGFQTTEILFDRPERIEGLTKFNYSKLCKLALNGLLSFSIKPIKWITISGLIIIISALIAFITSGMLFGSILLMGGLNLFGMGIVGLYIAKIHEEVMGRPIYLINKIYDGGHGR